MAAGLRHVPEPDTVRSYLPEKCRGHVIITSRISLGQRAEALPVPVFPREKSVEFLLNRTKLLTRPSPQRGEGEEIPSPLNGRGVG